MADPLEVSLADFGTRTSSGIGTAIDIGARRSAARLVVDTSAASGGNAGLAIEIQTSTRSDAGWTSAKTVNGQNVGRVDLSLANLQRFVRTVWTITGTAPSFDFSVTGTAHVLYVTPEKLSKFGARDGAFDDVDDDAMAEGCLAATDEAVSYLRRRYVMPLQSWSPDVERFVAQIATYEIFSVRGFDGTAADEIVVRRAGDARTWFKSVGAGSVTPDGIVDSTAPRANSGAAPRVHSAGRRGSEWDC